MKTAKFIKVLDGFTGDARLYELSEPAQYDTPWNDDDPPAKNTAFVIVSATIGPYSGPETYIFPSNSDGEVVDRGELDGSYRGALNHERALNNAGYTLEAQ